MDPIEFEHFFEKKSGHWTDSRSAEEIILELRWNKEAFFYDTTTDKNLINAGVLVEALRGDIRTNRLTSKARELCRELFRMEWVEKPKANVQYTENFLRLKAEYGPRMVAHGVEIAKGGLTNIVMMCITGTVKAISLHWGRLIDGAPNKSPVPHGPYFIIYDIKLSSQDPSSQKPPPHNPSCEQIAYVLVPCLEVAALLKEKLAKAKDMELITQETLEKFQSKIVTYDELYGICSSSVLEQSQSGAFEKRKHSLESASANAEALPKRRRIESTFFASNQVEIVQITTAVQPPDTPAP